MWKQQKVIYCTEHYDMCKILSDHTLRTTYSAAQNFLFSDFGIFPYEVKIIQYIKHLLLIFYIHYVCIICDSQLKN